MGVFSNLFSNAEKEEPVVTELRSIGSKDNKIRQRSMKKVTERCPKIIPTLIWILENREVENQWVEVERTLNSLDSSTRSAVKHLIWDLNSNDRKRIKEGKRKLQKIPADGRVMIETIAGIELAKQHAQFQKEAVVEILNRVDLPPQMVSYTIQGLINTILDETLGISDSAEEVLAKFGGQTEPFIMQALSTEPPGGPRRTLIKILQKSGGCSPKSVKVLIQLLSDSTISIPVIEMLGNMKSAAKSAVTPLINLHSFYTYRNEISAALKKIGPSNIDALCKGLEHKDPLVRETVANLLSDIPEKASIALPKLYNLLLDNNKKVMGAAARAICFIGPGEEGLDPLMKALCYDNWEISDNVSKALASLGNIALPHILKKLKDGSDIERRNAAAALGYIESDAETILPALEKVLEDEDELVRRSTLGAIANFGSEATYLVPRLIRIWEETAEDTVIDALSKLGDPIAIDLTLKLVYQSPRNGIPNNARRWLMEFAGNSQLSEKIIEWALQASTYEHKYRGWKYDEGYISLELSNNGIKSLCNVKSPVTSNILHFVAKKNDISVTMDNGCGHRWQKLVSFQEQRNEALAELQSRGNPPYDFRLFIDKGEDLNKHVEEEIKAERDRRYRRLLSGARRPVEEDGESKWQFYEELAEEFKTVEVLELLTYDLLKHSTIPLGDLNRIEWLLFKTSQGLDMQTVNSVLSCLQVPWPNVYSTTINRYKEFKKNEVQDAE